MSAQFDSEEECTSSCHYGCQLVNDQYQCAESMSAFKIVLIVVAGILAIVLVAIVVHEVRTCMWRKSLYRDANLYAPPPPTDSGLETSQPLSFSSYVGGSKVDETQYA